MAKISCDDSLFQALSGKVVVLTGGATGIGRSTVQQFCEHGAKVVFGDIHDEAAEKLASMLGSSVVFQHCDITVYDQQLALFERAENRFGGVDIVVANAGVLDPDDRFAPSQDLTVEPRFPEIDVNLKGTLYTTRIGLDYLRRHKGGDLVILSSIAGFKEAGGLTPYLASKHGIIGILRGLRLTTGPTIRVNAVSPWMTRTAMVHGIEDGWINQGLPVNQPSDVARAVLICATANRGSGKTHPGCRLPFNGKNLFVAGSEAYEIEDKLWELEPVWLGEDNSKALEKGQSYLAADQTQW